LTVGVDEVLMFGAGVLFDLFVELADVGGGNGGVATGFGLATGHLFTIKSGFGNTDGIRNLEYEYDLMDNVTQRQNHQSGLSESFQTRGWIVLLLGG
jgi:hypothetical protein